MVAIVSDRGQNWRYGGDSVPLCVESTEKGSGNSLVVAGEYGISEDG